MDASPGGKGAARHCPVSDRGLTRVRGRVRHGARFVISHCWPWCDVRGRVVPPRTCGW